MYSIHPVHVDEAWHTTLTARSQTMNKTGMKRRMGNYLGVICVSTLPIRVKTRFARLTDYWVSFDSLIAFTWVGYTVITRVLVEKSLIIHIQMRFYSTHTCILFGRKYLRNALSFACSSVVVVYYRIRYTKDET